MRLDVRIENQDLKGALRTYIQRRLHFALGRFSGKLGRVRVRLEDVPGAGKFFDASCRIQAELRPSGRILRQEAVDRNLFIAVDLATDRIGRSFERAFEAGGGTGGFRVERDAAGYPVKRALPRILLHRRTGG